MDQGTGKAMSDKPILFSGAMVRAILDGRKVQTRRILKETIPLSPTMDAIHPTNTAKHPAPYLDSYCGDRKTEANPRGMSRRWCWWTRDDRQGLPTFGVRWVPGDRLWVRETWADVNTENGPAIMFRAGGFHFCTDDAYPVEYDRYPGMLFSMWCGDLARGAPGHAWRPSIFMPRWASRISLDVTDVRVERLQDITEADAIAEGCEFTDFGEYQPQGVASLDGGKTFHPFKMRQHNGWHWGNATRPDQCLGSALQAYGNLWEQLNGAGSWDANPFVVALTFRVVTPDA